MRLLAIAILALAPAAAVAAAPAHPARDMQRYNPDGNAGLNCPPISRYEASRRDGRLAPRYLDELPGADLYKAVYRHVGGCNVPIIVRFNIGRSEMGSAKR